MTVAAPADRLDGRRVLLIVSGGIAAYKSLELIRLLTAAGCLVRCVLTDAGAQFVTPLSLQALSNNPVHTTLWSLTDESEMGHIVLSRSADLVVVCPASADILARMAGGHASDLATTLLLATDTPVLVAPAMNVRMWLHPATQANVATLRDRGVRFVGPHEGVMACNEFGPGRLAEPPAVLQAIARFFAKSASAAVPDTPTANDTATGTPNSLATFLAVSPATAPAPARPASLAGRHVLVTAGPTHEPIDPVRFIANRSSGQQGYAIAAALAARGARVTLVSGPTSLTVPPGVDRVEVETAREMLAASVAALPADAAVLTAAVADWRAEQVSPDKLKKRPGEALAPLALALNPDILAHLSEPGAERPALVIGFAAETNDLLSNASAKLARKGCDWIVANDVGTGSDIMGGTENQIHLLTAAGTESWPRLAKTEVAARLAERIAAALASS